MIRFRRPGTLCLVATLVGFVTSSCIGDGNSTTDPELVDTAGAGSNGNGAAGENGTAHGGAGGELTEDTAGAGGHGEAATAGHGASGGEPGSSSGGSGARGGSDATAGEGGSGATANAGGSAGTAGASTNGGGPDGGSEGGSGGEGTAGGANVDVPPALTVCERLINPPDNSFDVTQGYRAATTRDCRISWVTRLYLDEDQEHVFLNQLLRWNLELWGCGGAPPPDSFGLLFREVPLTSADADALIELYLDTTSATLAMSSDEIDAMRAMLDYLAERVIERETDEFTDSHCSTGAGGEGGAP